MDFSIGEAAKAAHTTVQTIRYYERLGLIPETVRTESGQRRYDEQAVRRMAFIRHARSLGFSLEQIGDLLELSDHPEQSCDRAHEIAAENLQKVRDRLAALRDLEQELSRMAGISAGGTSASCRVIEILADHHKCLHDEHPVPEKSGV